MICPSTEGNSCGAILELDSSRLTKILIRSVANDNCACERTPGSQVETAKRSSYKKTRRSEKDTSEYEMLYGFKPQSESDSENHYGDGGKINLELIDKDEGTRGVYDDDDELVSVFYYGTGELDRSARTFSILVVGV